MIKKWVEILYKVMCNFFIKRDGVESRSDLMAWIGISWFMIVFLINMVIITSIVFNKDMFRSYGKFNNMLIIGALSELVYFLLFNIIKVKDMEKEGSTYIIDSKYIPKLVWVIFIVNMLLVFVLGLLRKAYFDL